MNGARPSASERSRIVAKSGQSASRSRKARAFGLFVRDRRDEVVHREFIVVGELKNGKFNAKRPFEFNDEVYRLQRVDDAAFKQIDVAVGQLDPDGILNDFLDVKRSWFHRRIEVYRVVHRISSDFKRRKPILPISV